MEVLVTWCSQNEPQCSEILKEVKIKHRHPPLTQQTSSKVPPQETAKQTFLEFITSLEKTQKYKDKIETLSKFFSSFNDLNKDKVAFDVLDAFLRKNRFLCGTTLGLCDVLGFIYLDLIDVKIENFKSVTRWLKTLHLNLNHIKSTQKLETLRFVPKNMQLNFLKGIDPLGGMPVATFRFPPEPSGYLHVGHAKAATLNAYFAQITRGRLILRFDDTNPAKESEDFVEAILEDVERLGITPSKVTFSSDHFELTAKLCKEMITCGNAYVDDTPVLLMREQRTAGICSQCRDHTVEENLRFWNQMVGGEDQGLKFCVRAKIDMSAKNKCLRDPVIYRCVLTPHHRTKDKFKVYPTYDFACPIIDCEENVTVALRTNEYADRIPQYQWMIQTLKLRPIQIYEFSRLNMVKTLLSKRKLRELVNQGLVQGWDDPRMPTLKGIFRRGLEPAVLIEFILLSGASKVTVNMEWDKLWSMNKKALEPIAPRFMAVLGDRKEASILGVSQLEEKDGAIASMQVSRKLHPKNASLGVVELTRASRIWIEAKDIDLLNLNERVNLSRWGTFSVESLMPSVILRLVVEDQYDSENVSLHWVPAITNLTPVRVWTYDSLLLHSITDDDTDWTTAVNRNSEHEVLGVADPLVAGLKAGDKIQFERHGFCRLDRFDINKLVEFISIPVSVRVSKKLSFRMVKTLGVGSKVD